MQHQVLIFFYLCLCVRASVCLSAFLVVRLFVLVCRTSQQEQPKCAPLMSSHGRPPAKSQRLALRSTPLPMSPFPPLFPPPLHLMPSSTSLSPLPLFVIFHHLYVFANLCPFSALRLNSSSLLGFCAEGYGIADREETRNIWSQRPTRMEGGS